MRGKLTLISAPAGFGKTTLVSEWVTGGKRPVAWLSLDDGDNDLKRFLVYLVAPQATDMVVARKLWDLSAEVVHLADGLPASTC